MDANSITKENKHILDLTEEIHDSNNGNQQEVIVVDGRGYKKASRDGEEVYNLIDVVDDNLSADINQEIIARSEKIIERIARKVVPEIAERIIREEIEKLKKTDNIE